MARGYAPLFAELLMKASPVLFLALTAEKRPKFPKLHKARLVKFRRKPLLAASFTASQVEVYRRRLFF